MLFNKLPGPAVWASRARISTLAVRYPAEDSGSGNATATIGEFEGNDTSPVAHLLQYTRMQNRSETVMNSVPNGWLQAGNPSFQIEQSPGVTPGKSRPPEEEGTTAMGVRPPESLQPERKPRP